MNRSSRVIAIIAFALVVPGLLPWTVVAASESSPAIEQAFQKAREDFLEKNMRSAAEQIQKGASYLRDEAAKASAKGREALAASAEELEKLAGDVKKGVVKSEKRVEEAFARAYHALALESHIRSTESWAKKEAAKAGESLDSAARNLERSLTWAGQKVEDGTKEVMKKSRDLSLKMREKGALVGEEVGKGLKAAGNEIEKLGKRISSK